MTHFARHPRQGILFAFVLVATVLVVAVGIEAFDAFDDWVDLGRWRYQAHGLPASATTRAIRAAQDTMTSERMLGLLSRLWGLSPVEVVTPVQRG